MAGRTFQVVTAGMLALTLLCLGINVLGWTRLRALARVTSDVPATLTPREIEGLGQLTGLIRLEAVYFTLLFLYALAYPGALAWGPVLFVVLYHWFGWAANEWTGATSQAVAHLQQDSKPAPSFRARARTALTVIGVLDALEAIVLIYIMLALAGALRHAGA
ncbi:MAG: hypothetical protein N0A16_03640 [Blastocatellia bacterium]|nr:hypothetical protein [Blastocatellia bacterium]MCS7156805.1 hypothetical protein [Blastocatellia bacterium]MCX7752763.1 hypothetical protein [Blastocatellia bacterium]MDW8167496.1 hypothetical protein [Acidobacteriota bacterium]MDW8256843.1 hypothetical protein [Acidobacteriota bacterium]